MIEDGTEDTVSTDLTSRFQGFQEDFFANADSGKNGVLSTDKT